MGCVITEQSREPNQMSSRGDEAGQAEMVNDHHKRLRFPQKDGGPGNGII